MRSLKEFCEISQLLLPLGASYIYPLPSNQDIHLTDMSVSN